MFKNFNFKEQLMPRVKLWKEWLATIQSIQHNYQSLCFFKNTKYTSMKRYLFFPPETPNVTVLRWNKYSAVQWDICSTDVIYICKFHCKKEKEQRAPPPKKKRNSVHSCFLIHIFERGSLHCYVFYLYFQIFTEYVNDLILWNVIIN